MAAGSERGNGSSGPNGRTLTLAMLAEAKRLPADYLRELGLHDLAGGGVGIPYYGPAGEEIAVKRRTAIKATEGSYWPRGTPLAAYGHWRLDRAARVGFLIVVEGESDCWALWHHGLPALGIPGANAAKTLLREHVEAVEKVYVHREPDQGGATFVEGIRGRLAALGFKGKAFTLRMPDGAKDPADLHALDAQQFSERLENAIVASIPIDLHPAGSPGVQGKSARTLEPYQPFPVEALPTPVDEYVRQTAAALGCDPAYVALPALAVIASVIGNTRTIRLKRGWEEPCIVWSAIVGESGTLKTPAYLRAVAHLYRVQKRLRAEYKQAVATYQDKCEEYRAKKQAAKKGEGPDPGDPPEDPVLRRVVCSDTTIEKLAEILEDNPRGTLLARDELSAWLGSFCRYKGKQGGTDLPNWLEMFRAGTVIVDRKTGERRQLFIERAAVSVSGTIQPGVLAKALTPEFLDAGLAARLLLAMPVAPPKRWSEVEVAPEAEAAYENTLDRLLTLDFGRDAKGERVPQVLHLSTEAKAAWVEFYNVWAREQAAAEGELAAAFSKLEAYAARFALLHHVATCVALDADDRREISVRSVRAGIALCFWFAAEARRIYATFSETATERATRKLVEHIQAQGGRISARQLQRSNSRKYPNSETAEEALEALAQDGLAVWEEPVLTPRGGQPARYLRLNPTVDTTDTTANSQANGDGRAADTTADSTPVMPGFSREIRGSVGSVNCRIHEAAPKAGPAPLGGSVGRPEVVSGDGDGRGDAWEGPDEHGQG
jgi:hypothetical protein